MFDNGPDRELEQERESDRVKNMFFSFTGLVILLLDDYFRRPEISLLRILTYVAIFITSIVQFRVGEVLDRSALRRLALFATVGFVLLFWGLFTGSLPVWLMGLALVVVAWLVPRWYSESGGPVMRGPDVH